MRGLLLNVLAAAPYVTNVERAQGGTPVVHISINQPAFKIRKELENNIGFPILVELMKKSHRTVYYRGIEPKKLQNALDHGIDVNPFFATDSFEKALEYGGEYPLVLILDAQKIESSFRTIHPDAERHAEKLAAARLDFKSPGILDGGTGQWLFSHFPETHPSRLTGYEFAYGHRLAGEPRDALLAALLFEDMGPSAER